jgi:hypothetical protein
MPQDNSSLERTCKTMLDSLIAGSRNTLCINIANPTFSAEVVAQEHLESKGKKVTTHKEPTAPELGRILEQLTDDTAIVTFADLDKSPNCIGVLLEHAQKTDVKGRVVVVSRDWNSDNTPKELELRKFCLFYQQNVAPEPKSTQRVR